MPVLRPRYQLDASSRVTPQPASSAMGAGQRPASGRRSSLSVRGHGCAEGLSNSVHAPNRPVAWPRSDEVWGSKPSDGRRVDVLVIGAAVIGTVYGAQLAAHGHAVSVLAHGTRTGEVAAHADDLPGTGSSSSRPRCATSRRASSGFRLNKEPDDGLKRRMPRCSIDVGTRVQRGPARL